MCVIVFTVSLFSRIFLKSIDSEGIDYTVSVVRLMLNHRIDPLILEDVQKALDTRARRLTQQRSPSAGVSQDSRDSTNSSQTIARKLSRSSSPTTVPGPRPSGHLPFQYPSKIYFPSSRHASSLSLQSNSSEELPSKSPVPVLFSLPDGTSYLDWSGATTLGNPQSKDKLAIKRRTFSLSKPKVKPGEFSRNGGSLGLGTSQKDLHVGKSSVFWKDNIYFK